jgi:hypothetical protein
MDCNARRYQRAALIQSIWLGFDSKNKKERKKKRKKKLKRIKV